MPFSYRAVWQKDNFANALLCNKAMVSYFEDVCVFFKKHDTLAAHPLRGWFCLEFERLGFGGGHYKELLGNNMAGHYFTKGIQFCIPTRANFEKLRQLGGFDRNYDDLKAIDDAHKKTVARIFNLHDGKKYKSNILEYKKDYSGYHPTQKPVLLLEDLIKTYSNEGDTVLDFTMGSGSTGVACVNTGRDFIGIERDEGYFKIAQERISDAPKAKPQNGKLEL